MITLSHAATDANVIVAFSPQLPIHDSYDNIVILSHQNRTRKYYMRIRDAVLIRDVDKNTSKTTITKSTNTGSFAAELTQKQDESNSYEQEVDQLRKEIEQAGDKLEKEPTLGNFRRFRELLSNLAKKISDEAYQLEKIIGTPQNPRYFEIIRVINTEADQLYDLLLREQRSNMSITAKVICIKGLVVDLIT